MFQTLLSTVVSHRQFNDRILIMLHTGVLWSSLPRQIGRDLEASSIHRNGTRNSKIAHLDKNMRMTRAVVYKQGYQPDRLTADQWQDGGPHTPPKPPKPRRQATGSNLACASALWTIRLALVTTTIAPQQLSDSTVRRSSRNGWRPQFTVFRPTKHRSRRLRNIIIISMKWREGHQRRLFAPQHRRNSQRIGTDRILAALSARQR